MDSDHRPAEELTSVTSRAAVARIQRRPGIKARVVRTPRSSSRVPCSPPNYGATALHVDRLEPRTRVTLLPATDGHPWINPRCPSPGRQREAHAPSTACPSATIAYSPVRCRVRALPSATPSAVRSSPGTSPSREGRNAGRSRLSLCTHPLYRSSATPHHARARCPTTLNRYSIREERTAESGSVVGRG